RGEPALLATGIDTIGNVGGYFTDSGSLAHGFCYTGSGYTILNAPSSTNTFAQAMDSTGKVAGYYLDNTASQLAHGFIWSSSSGFGPSINVPGATNTYIYAIADDGEVGGSYD